MTEHTWVQTEWERSLCTFQFVRSPFFRIGVRSQNFSLLVYVSITSSITEICKGSLSPWAVSKIQVGDYQDQVLYSFFTCQIAASASVYHSSPHLIVLKTFSIWILLSTSVAESTFRRRVLNWWFSYVWSLSLPSMNMFSLLRVPHIINLVERVQLPV